MVRPGVNLTIFANSENTKKNLLGISFFIDR